MGALVKAIRADLEEHFEVHQRRILAATFDIQVGQEVQMVKGNWDFRQCEFWERITSPERRRLGRPVSFQEAHSFPTGNMSFRIRIQTKSGNFGWG